MNQDLLPALRELRSEIIHGASPGDPASLGKRLRELAISVPAADLPWFVADLLRGFGKVGEYYVPPVVVTVIESLLKGRSADVACDPWAGLGVLAATVRERVQARRMIACSHNLHNVALGRVLVPQVEWHAGAPLAVLETLTESLDVAASVLPFGMRALPGTVLRRESGEIAVTSADLASLLFVAVSLRLSSNGLGVFVVAPSFFLSRDTVVPQLTHLGIGIDAALALPAGSFAPFANVTAYLVIVRRGPSDRMFVAQLSTNEDTNHRILANFRDRRADGALELGRFVAPTDFRGLDSLRLAERLQQAEERFAASRVSLGDLIEDLRFGRSGEFAFGSADNACYIPLIGISDVVNSSEAMTLKHQNYAQVLVDARRSDARFVAHFLNSELGRAIREAHKSGTTIGKLNSSGLRALPILVPSIATQRRILEVAAKLAAEQNTLLGLRNELETMQRELWRAPDLVDEIASQVQAFAGRLAPEAAQHASETLDQWVESLPFPLASILRAWQATPSSDSKEKYRHLLHFFEAAAEFLSVVYLSAFASQPEIFAGHKERLAAIWKSQNLSIRRATFGTWKVVVEYLSKQTRALLSGDADKRALCAELFADPNQGLPVMLARRELATVLSATSKMRNDWGGHGGIVGQPEAALRNEQLLAELQTLREVMADGWHQVQLVRCLQCQPRRGSFHNELALLVGSNSEFLKERRSMTMVLDVEHLYLAARNSGRALKLLPLIRVGPSPASALNACYFFNRAERDGARFVSYHFVDRPELKDDSPDTAAVIELLSEGQVDDRSADSFAVPD